MPNVHLIFVILGSLVGTTIAQLPNGYELPPVPSYVILTPQTVRPNEILQTSVSILHLLYKQLTIRLSVKMEELEYAATTEVFKSTGTRIMFLKIPGNTMPGNYFVHVEGSITPNSSIIFSNRTKINYNPQQVSLFIQTCKPIYHQGQTIRFRVIPVQPNLLPMFGTLMTVTVTDATGLIVRRWINPMTNVGGIIEKQLQLSNQITEGMWNIEAKHESFLQKKSFRVQEYWEPRFDVNVSLPLRFSDDGFGVFGMIMSNHTSGIPVKGNCAIKLELRDPKMDKYTTPPLVAMSRVISVFEGQADFLFTMNELRAVFGGKSISNLEVWVNVTVRDWFLNITMEGFAYSYVYPSDPQIKFFGGMVRPFKPDMYFTAYILVYQPDGTKVFSTENRRVGLRINCEDTSVVIKNEPALPIPDDGVIMYTFTPVSPCIVYRLNAEFFNIDQSVTQAEQFITRYSSESNTYIQVTTTTIHPRVDEYAVFNVKTNYPTDTIYYQIAAFGNIMYADKLIVPNAVLSRTFSVAISRDMAPVARIVVFFVKMDGEVVSDSLTFFSNITRLNNVRAHVNRGKDLNVDEVEVIGNAEPGSFMAFSAINYDLFLHGGTSILQDYDLIDEMERYEAHAQFPYKHSWVHDDYIERVYFPSPSFGMDTNSTFNSSGLILFTDANFTKVNFYHDCNETEDVARAFPCFSTGSKDCFSRNEKCDGIAQCVTKVDEMGCPAKETGPKPRNLLDVYNRLYRHWQDAGWMWKSSFTKWNGQIEFKVPLPKITTSWIMGTFAIDPKLGLSIMQRPAVFDGVRRFFITTQMPEAAIWGEQVGVRVAVFNYWNYWAEALLEVKRSTDYEVIRMSFIRDWQGAVQAYSPTRTSNQAVQTLVYLEAGQGRYVHIPVVPKTQKGNITVTICAYTFIGSNCESKTLRVKMPGVSNYWHTAKFQDLTSSSSLEINGFKILVTQMFVVPEERQHRYIPGSQAAKIVLTGDVIGPSLSKEMPFTDTFNSLRMPHGAAENVLFELGYNLQLVLYLKASGYLSNEILHAGIDYCNMVIQEGLSFYNPKLGAFANFRESLDKPSVLATSLAIWSYLDSRISEYDRLIYVEDKLFHNTVTWLRTQQETDDTNGLAGSFPVSEVYDRKFLPFINASVKNPEAHRRVALTAMVIVAITTSNSLPSGIAKEQGDMIKDAGARFLIRYVLQVEDIFAKVIATYALQSASDSSASDYIAQALRQLKARNQGGQGRFYLANYKIPPSISELTEAGVRIENPRDEYPNEGYAVAATSIYFSLMMQRNEWTSGGADANNMVEWLASMRNHMIGFASTFDSLFAMKSLKAYALTDKNRALYKMVIGESISANSNWKRFVTIRESNYSTAAIENIPTDDVWGQVLLNPTGTGKILLQLDVSANVEYTSKQKYPYNPDDKRLALPSFDIECGPEYSTGRNDSIIYMKVCGKWTGVNPPEAAPQSGMAVFEIDLPTGYVILNDKLRSYVESKVVPNLRYSRFYPGKIYFYFDNITTVETCVHFRIDRFYPVANVSIEYLCKAYEYYEPGRYNNSLYRMRSLNTMNVCNVCGSYQCPYCPDYNTAALLRASLPLILLCFTLLMARYGRLSHILSRLVFGIGTP